jgi:RNA polymerase sigma-70 factor, ECF subfamily
MSDGSPRDISVRAAGEGLLSDEPTVELIAKAQRGDRAATEALIQRCLPALRRWAHGKLPPAARGYLDTGDLVQEAAFNAVRHLDTFEHRHVGAMQAYLTRSVINRIRDEVRRVGRRGTPAELPDDVASDVQSPLEFAIAAQAYDRYRDALRVLKPRDRQIVVSRVELQWTAAEVADRFGFRSVAAARMATTRAVERLATELGLALNGL